MSGLSFGAFFTFRSSNDGSSFSSFACVGAIRRIGTWSISGLNDSDSRLCDIFDSSEASVAELGGGAIDNMAALLRTSSSVGNPSGGARPLSDSLCRRLVGGYWKSLVLTCSLVLNCLDRSDIATVPIVQRA